MAKTSDIAERIGALLGVQVAGVQPAGGQHGYRHLTATLADGRAAFVKAAFDKAAPGGSESESHDHAVAFAAEANGLRWLAEPGTTPVPAVLGADDSMLVIELLPGGRPSPQAARDFGASLARLHAAGAPSFGAPWPGCIASLPLDNTPLDNTPLDNTPLDNTAAGGNGETNWGRWYAERRIVPYLAIARDRGAIDRADISLVETVVSRIGELSGPPEPPSRIHGDLWSGNVLWSGGRGWLIDPAAHGGHRETDLAMLALFGAPYLDEILRAYVDTVPLADGWPSRVRLHQLHPLLVHCCLFGSSYAAQLRAAARAVLTA